MGMLKRQCRLSGKPFVPLRTSSVASLLAGLASLASLHRPGAAGA
jgi:hypothetical protein